MNDILLAIKDIDKKESAVMPKFVAQHLDKLPRVTLGEIDVVSLLERISMLEKRQSCLTHNAARPQLAGGRCVVQSSATPLKFASE